MHNFINVLFLVLAKIHANEDATNSIIDMRHSMDSLTDKVDDKVQRSMSGLVDKLIDKLINRFFGQELDTLPLHREHVMGTTLGKPGHLMASRASLRSFPALPVMRGGIQQHSRIMLRDVTAAQEGGKPNGGMGGGLGQLEKGLFGEDFGARDATTGEKESGFGERLGDYGNWDTVHKVKPPDQMGSVIGIKTWKISAEYAEPLDESEINTLKPQIRGWQVEKDGDNQFKLVHDWRLKDDAAPKVLEERFQAVAQSLGHSWTTLTHVDGQTVRLELQTAKDAKTVSMNDLILAAQLNEVPVKDLKPKPKAKFWGR